MSIDVKEIYQLVLENVKGQVEQIKADYGKQLCKKMEEDVRALYEDRIATLEKKNTSLKQQCTELKKKVKKLEDEIEERNSDYSVNTRYDVYNRDLDVSGKLMKITSMQVNQLYEYMEEQERRKNEPKKEAKPYWEELPGQNNCFITTAVCEYYGKEDDCEELTKLRHYRDKWLANIEGGKELIEEYYRCGPEIVKRIKTSDNYAEYCETLMSTYISECLKMIDKGEFENCKNKYIEMVDYASKLK